MFEERIVAHRSRSFEVKCFTSNSTAIARADTITDFPRLNEPARDFTAKTTHGDRSLADFKGKWLILFSHSADFTPVCTAEFIGFANAADTFKSMNCELLGLSIDSLFSHLAWTRNFQDKFGVKIPFPIIEDIKINEFVRLLQAMQTSDKQQIATPEGWTAGCDVIVPPPKTADAADKRAGEGYKTTDWCYSTRLL